MQSPQKSAPIPAKPAIGHSSGPSSGFMPQLRALSQEVNPSGRAFTGPMTIGSCSLLTVFTGGSGSEKTHKGNAKVTKAFLKSST